MSTVQKVCLGSGVRVTDKWLPGVGFYCPVCQRRSTVTAHGKIPRHNRGQRLKRTWSSKLGGYTYDHVSLSRCQCVSPQSCSRFHTERRDILNARSNNLR